MTRGDKETRTRGGEEARRRGGEENFASSPLRCFASYTQDLRNHVILSDERSEKSLKHPLAIEPARDSSLLYPWVLRFAPFRMTCVSPDTLIYSWLAVTLVLALAGLSLFACGRGEPASGEPTANLLAATPLSTHVFQQPTTIIKLSTPEEAGTPASAEDVDLTRGERTYSDKKCAECHGTQGEGVPDKAKALAGMQLSEQEFTDVLRTGGQGKLGNEHLYGPQAISRSGMKALYAYLKSLPAP